MALFEMTNLPDICCLTLFIFMLVFDLDMRFLARGSKVVFLGGFIWPWNRLPVSAGDLCSCQRVRPHGVKKAGVLGEYKIGLTA